MRIAIPDLISNSYFPAIAAADLGFFEAEGLATREVELAFPVTKAMQALRDGELDFVAGSANTALAAFPQWQGAKLLVALAQKMYWVLVLRSDLGAKRGDIQAVKGLRIGAAPGPDLGLRALFAHAGIDPQRDGVQVGPIPSTMGGGVSFGVTAARALEEGQIDGFWANAMGAEVAVRRGIGEAILDVRREGPPGPQDCTFPALVATDEKIQDKPETVAGAIRAIIKAQKALREQPGLATEIGRRLFPSTEADLIRGLVERDLPFYDPTISEDAVVKMNRSAQSLGLLPGAVPYSQVVATRFRHLWQE